MDFDTGNHSNYSKKVCNKIIKINKKQSVINKLAFEVLSTYNSSKKNPADCYCKDFIDISSILFRMCDCKYVLFKYHLGDSYQDFRNQNPIDQLFQYDIWVVIINWSGCLSYDASYSSYIFYNKKEAMSKYSSCRF